MVHAATLPADAPETYDFIVVGGGTAGCVVAGRLAENPNVSILVIEAGRNDPANIEAIMTPAKAMSLRGSQHDWAYKTTMIDRPEYTRVEKPNTRGKVLGGSSSLNYYTYLRGSKGPIDDWAEFGGDDWTWDNCIDYFNKSISFRDDDNVYQGRIKMGTEGPLKIAHAELVPELEPFRTALEQAWVSKGQELSEDVFNGTQKGLFKCVDTIYQGQRSNSAIFIEGKKNITLVSSTNSSHIEIENGKATGINVIGPDGATYLFKAKYEVIIAQGVYESPKLLMLSGIGPKDHLTEQGIDVKIDSPHVGQNLLDHPILSHVFKMKDGYGMDDHLLRAGPAQDGAISAYRKNKSGPLSSGLLEMVAFPRIDEALNKNKSYRDYVASNNGIDPFGPHGEPHFEIDFVPMFADAFQWHFPTPAAGNYLTVIVDLMRPLSQNGTVKLSSRNPLDQAAININFFSHDLDIVAMREGVRVIDDIIMNGDGLKDIIESDYPWPMARTSDAAMDKLILERSQTGFHPCGTCRLSQSISQGVVDPRLNVHGLSGLRVIDASVFPVIPDCRIQADVYMVAEKGADYIKMEYPDLY